MKARPSSAEIWILAKLYSGECISNKNLLRQLCKEAFSEMIDNNLSFPDLLTSLKDAKLIDSCKRQENWGYGIAEEGIIYLRKNYLDPLNNAIDLEDTRDNIPRDAVAAHEFYEHLSDDGGVRNDKIIFKILENTINFLSLFYTILSSYNGV